MMTQRQNKKANMGRMLFRCQPSKNIPTHVAELTETRCRRMPAGCRACGNPDYPRCKDSCPLFD